MNAAELRMRRLFDADSGRADVVAIDHGMQFGCSRARRTRSARSTEPDALLIFPGLLPGSAEP
jgi:DhnA family fructose-bisphosphate aldolase class Ia